jgi:hypothetical protein
MQYDFRFRAPTTAVETKAGLCLRLTILFYSLPVLILLNSFPYKLFFFPELNHLELDP